MALASCHPKAKSGGRSALILWSLESLTENREHDVGIYEKMIDKHLYLESLDHLAFISRQEIFVQLLSVVK